MKKFFELKRKLKKIEVPPKKGEGEYRERGTTG